MIPVHLLAQILPLEGSKLNYRLIGFSFPPVQKVSKFTIEIADGNISTEDTFKKKIIVSLNSKNNKIVAEVPAFGRQYTWRTSYTINSKIIKSELHHFSTLTATEVDTAHVRLRILKKATKFKDAYVFSDGNRVLYDMNGHPVWFLPDADRFYAPKPAQMPSTKHVYFAGPSTFIPTNDMKISPQGTITFVYYETAYEVNYNGDILWKAPDIDKIDGPSREIYHHEFTKLANGHYIALKNENVKVAFVWKDAPAGDSSLVPVPANEIKSAGKKIFYKVIELALVKEYDHEGNVVWQWRSADFFIDQDKGKDLDYSAAINTIAHQEVHANSLFFDEKDSVMYVGFRNISRIIKIKYPSGKVLNTYGDDHTNATVSKGTSMFCNQHGCRRSDHGYLYLFNNNLCNEGLMPEVLKLQEPVSTNENLKIIWTYLCTFEGMEQEKGEATWFYTGGNVLELPDMSLFVNMGSDHSKMFILGPDKQVLWSALPERFNIQRKWAPNSQYRASIILGRKEMERLIWGEEDPTKPR